MPRPTETNTSKLLRLIDELSSDEVRFAQEILKHAERKDQEAKPKVTRGRKRHAVPTEEQA